MFPVTCANRDPGKHVTRNADLILTALGRILVQVTIYRRLLIGRDGHLDQSEAYDISQLVREYRP